MGLKKDVFPFVWIEQNQTNVYRHKKNEDHFIYSPNSSNVIRFGKILPHLHNFKSLGHIFEHFLVCGKMFILLWQKQTGWIPYRKRGELFCHWRKWNFNANFKQHRQRGRHWFTKKSYRKYRTYKSFFRILEIDKRDEYKYFPIFKKFLKKIFLSRPVSLG